MENKIVGILKELGIPMGNLGFGYIKEAVKMVARDKSWLRDITGPEGLYAVIAETFHTKASRVERAIRHAIEQCFLNGDTEIIYKQFGNSASVKSGKLTNRNFIAALANEVLTDNEDAVKGMINPVDGTNDINQKIVADCSDEELITVLFNRIRN